MVESSQFTDCVKGRRCPVCPLDLLQGDTTKETEAVNELLGYYEEAPLGDDDQIKREDAQDYAGFAGAPEKNIDSIRTAGQLIIDGECTASNRYQQV